MEFYHRIRGERKFPTMEALADEIRHNAQQTRDYFQAAVPRSSPLTGKEPVHWGRSPPAPPKDCHAL